MANTTEMLRLMRHAANLLNEQDPTINAHNFAALSSQSNEKLRAYQRAYAEIAAITMASTVLRMVAAAMDDEPTDRAPAEPDVES